MRLWLDVGRWPTFVEGFAHVSHKDERWPADGSTLVWQSRPGGRGRVAERVESRGEWFISTRVSEESLQGVQTVRFDPAEDGALVQLSLEYELNPTSVWRAGALGRVTDLVFIRRALADSLARTLRRFAVEAAEEAAL